ncbi:MAG: selenocysteine-specific translation elongation factor [Kiritimatiellia bacterium]|jgi:selenocysteine-specific elongation factor
MTPAPATPTPARGVRLTLGTAGHIDHGKTSIVQSLTGTWCARLPEEKARGMTIDVGFAAWDDGEGLNIGIVDVPGHERFIHNMVAGASGIDVAMLVVAADDGVMPQTLEHVQILRMLGVRKGLVVLNKCDLADEARQAQVVADIRACVKDTFLENAACVPFSARTNAGLDALKAALRKVVSETAERDVSGPFLLHVERAFQLKGFGTILSGIPRSGSVKIGDEVEMLPDGTRHRVRGIQVYGRDVEQGFAGECAALRLSDLSRDAAARGKVVALPGYFGAHRFLNARFLHLPQNLKALEPRTAIMLHVGTSETPGHLVLPTLDKLAPGAESYVQIQLERPVVAAPGDFYLVRRRSPAQTLGGGTLIDCSDTKLRRGRGDWARARAEAEAAAGDDAEKMRLALEKAGNDPVHLDNWARLASVAPDAARAAADALAAVGKAIALPGLRYVAPAALDAARAAVVARLDSLHAANPLHRGFDRKTLCQGLPGSRLLLDRVFDALLADGDLVREADRFFLKAREPVLDKRQTALADNIAGLFESARYETPRPDSLPARLHITQAEADALLVNLCHRGVLVRLSDVVLLHAAWVAESERRLREHLDAHGRIDAGAFKDLLKTSRKFAIPLLEHWDAAGLTRRTGDFRVLRQPANQTPSQP